VSAELWEIFGITDKQQFKDSKGVIARKHVVVLVDAGVKAFMQDTAVSQFHSGDKRVPA